MYKAIVFILMLLTDLAYSQDVVTSSNGSNYLIKQQLNETDVKKLESLEDLEKEAMDLISVVDKSYEEVSKLKEEIDSQKDKKSREKLLKKSVKIEKKAVRKHVEALKTISEVYVNKYDFYKKDLSKFFNLDSNERTIEAKVLEKKAHNCFEIADLNVQKVYYTVNPNELFTIFTDAYKQEQLGLLYQEKIYALFLNWDISTDESIDKRIEAIISNKPDEQNQTIGSNNIKDSINLTTVVVYDTIKVEQIIDNIVYKVQIAASTTPLNIDKLKKIYPENDQIQYELDNGWYKYSVGYYSYYAEAQNFKTRIGVPGAFIVAYKNGKRVPLSELTNHYTYSKSN